MSAPVLTRHLISARVIPASSSSSRVTTPCERSAIRARTRSTVMSWGRTVTPRHHASRILPLAPAYPAVPEKRTEVLQPMAVAVPYAEKTDEQKAITEMVRQFSDEQIIPNAEHYDHEDEFPEPIVEQMKELGLFGITVPEEYGGLGLDLTTYAMVVEELSRGWISISGVINTHFIGTYLLLKFGTDEQKQKYLPRMATGEIRGAFSLSEPELG